MDEPAEKQQKTDSQKKSRKKAKMGTSKPMKNKAAVVAGNKRKVASASPKTPKRRRGLIPNPEIELLDFDPTFTKNSKVPLITVKQGIRAVLASDKELLEELIEDTTNVYTVNWQRSPHVKLGPYEYAIVEENKEMLEILRSEGERGYVEAERPKTDLEIKGTGR